MKKIITKSAEETKEFARSFAKDYLKGGILALSGELGAGKTTFAQGFAEGIGIKDRIVSPTFLIIRQYPIPGQTNFFYHIDLYRLENIDMKNSGLDEILTEPSNIVLIEWADKLGKDLPENIVKIQLAAVSEDEHEITV